MKIVIMLKSITQSYHGLAPIKPHINEVFFYKNHNVPLWHCWQVGQSVYIYIYFRPSVRRAVNVLRVSKYPPNAIFRNVNINAQRET